jgi:hypothetical protein
MFCRQWLVLENKDILYIAISIDYDYNIFRLAGKAPIQFYELWFLCADRRVLG